MKDQAPAVRDRILDAALRMLGESGVRTLVQPKVAKEAGVPQGHLTYYFPKRMDLLAAVAARFVERLREDAPGLLELAGNARARVDAAGRKRAMKFVAKLATDRSRTRTILGLLAVADEDAALRKQVSLHAKTVRGLVTKLVDLDDDDPDVDLALATLWGIGLMHLVFEDRSNAETERLLERFLARLDLEEASPKRSAGAKKPRD